MLPVHDITLHAGLRSSYANLMALGLDRCAERMSGRVPWYATTPESPLPQATSLRAGFKAVPGASAQV